jgi:methyltransferase (TIGR00027 family)
MKKRKASNTAQTVAYNRALGNLSPTVPGFSDPMAEKFLSSSWKKRFEKGRSKLPKSPYPFWFRGMGICNQFRTVMLDRAILTALPFEQLVILGAGFDGRAWRLQGIENTIVFEVDHPNTQQIKREKTAEHKPLTKEIRFVGMDFTRDNLITSLINADFNPKKKTFWLWEAVIMYLTPEKVVDTLAVISNCTIAGSSIAFTYMAKQNGKIPTSIFLKLLGEPVLSAYTTDEIAYVVKKCGWDLVSNTGIEDWKRELTPDLHLNKQNVGIQWYERIFIGKR